MLEDLLVDTGEGPGEDDERSLRGVNGAGYGRGTGAAPLRPASRKRRTPAGPLRRVAEEREDDGEANSARGAVLDVHGRLGVHVGEGAAEFGEEALGRVAHRASSFPGPIIGRSEKIIDRGADVVGEYTLGDRAHLGFEIGSHVVLLVLRRLLRPFSR